MAIPLIIDADPGIGDALAIGLSLFDPELEILAVTATGGCVPGPVATRNVEAIVTYADPPRSPRLGASDDPVCVVPEELLGEAPAPTGLNGTGGLGNWLVPEFERHRRHESAKVLVDLVRDHPNDLTLLTLGPLTSVIRAMELEPDFLQKLGGIVMLGGSIGVGGDVTAASEFNMFAAPTAARTVLRSPATKTLIPLDVTRQVELSFQQFDRLPDAEASPLCGMLHELLTFSFRAHRQELGRESIGLAEVVALAAVVHPELFERESMAVDVETHGHLTRGMTVFDRRGISRWQANIDVMTEVDAEAILDYFFRTISRSHG